MPSKNAKFNNRTPLYQRYFVGDYDKMWHYHKRGWTQVRIARKYGVTKARVQQILKRREELEKLGEVRKDMLHLSPQAAEWLQKYFGKNAVSRANVRGLLKRKPDLSTCKGVGRKMAAEITVWAVDPDAKLAA